MRTSSFSVDAVHMLCGGNSHHQLIAQRHNALLPTPFLQALVLKCMQELSEWACIYIKYLQIFRKLEAAYDQMLQPQKRQDMRKALEACMGRMLEIRHWLVRMLFGLKASAA